MLCIDNILNKKYRSAVQHIMILHSRSPFAFSALTLLVGRQEEHSAWKIEWWGVGVVMSEARCRLFAYGPADVTAIPKPHHLLPHLNPNWFLPFWYWLTQVVLEKRPSNVYSSSTTPWVKKTKHLTLAHNFTKYWPIFKILSPLDSVGNL